MAENCRFHKQQPNKVQTTTKLFQKCLLPIGNKKFEKLESQGVWIGCFAKQKGNAKPAGTDLSLSSSRAKRITIDITYLWGRYWSWGR